MALPSGFVTFLFTDIESSSRRWEDDPGRMRAVLARHDDIVRGAVVGFGGTVFKHLGDGICRGVRLDTGWPGGGGGRAGCLASGGVAWWRTVVGQDGSPRRRSDPGGSGLFRSNLESGRPRHGRCERRPDRVLGGRRGAISRVRACRPGRQRVAAASVRNGCISWPTMATSSTGVLFGPRSGQRRTCRTDSPASWVVRARWLTSSR